MIDKKRVKDRRDQIAAIPKNTDAQAALCARVVAHLDAALSAESPDLEALWADCDAAMESRLGDCSWQAPAKTERVFSAPAPKPEEPAKPESPPEISARTGKPKRKYTRRKKA